MSKNEESVLSELSALEKKYGLSASHIMQILQRKARNENHQKIVEMAEKNADLVGRCFCFDKKDLDGLRRLFDALPNAANNTGLTGEGPCGQEPAQKSGKVFLKVISYCSSNEFKVEALVFDEKPETRFHYQMSMAGRAGDFFLGRYSLHTFRTENILARSVRKMTEITEEEFDTAAKKHLDYLLDAQWDK